MNRKSRMKIALTRILALAAVALSFQAAAQDYPNKPITMVMPYAPGGPGDTITRVFAGSMQKLLGQQIVVDNTAGASGSIGTAKVARAKPDGYTLLLTSAMTHAVNPSLYDKLPYHPLEDFEPITQFGRLPFVVLVRADSPIKTLADLTALLKSEPGKHNFGAGSLPARIAGEMYKQLAGVQAVHIAYKSNPQAFPDLLSGLLTFMVIDTTNGRLQIDGGKMRGLAVTTLQREASLPKVPTTGEAGLPEFQIWTWTGFYAPKGTPRDIVLKAYQDILTACQDPQLQARFESLGGPPVNSSSPDEFAAFTRQEIDRWGRIIRRAQIRLD